MLEVPLGQLIASVNRSDETLILEGMQMKRIRNAIVLVGGRPGDTLPTRHTELTAVARLLGYPPGDATQALEQDYRRAARRARAVMEPLFYG